MLIVSASLKKSGTAWLFNMMNDLLVAAGQGDSRALRDSLGLQGVVRGSSCHIRPDWKNLRRVLSALPRDQALAASTHAGPIPPLLLFMATGQVKAICLYRDPRDATLSALDHGVRARRAGVENELADLHNVEDAAKYIERRLRPFVWWTRVPGVLFLRYEDLVGDAAGELRRVRRHLELDVPDSTVDEIVGRYSRSTLASEGHERLTGPAWRRTHFNRGVAGYFKEAMSPSDLALCERYFGPHLKRMGYAP